jgi:hypothetical protein
MHAVKEADMFVAKMDLLMKRLDERSHEKEAMKGTVHTIDLQMTCEVCGNVRHSGNDYSETHEDAAFINNGFRQNNNGWNDQSRRNEVIRISIPIILP